MENLSLAILEWISICFDAEARKYMDNESRRVTYVWRHSRWMEGHGRWGSGVPPTLGAGSAAPPQSHATVVRRSVAASPLFSVALLGKKQMERKLLPLCHVGFASNSL